MADYHAYRPAYYITQLLISYIIESLEIVVHQIEAACLGD